MTDQLKLHRPCLVAVWPGMGNVALSAGYYLMAKLGMHQVAEFSAREFFDVEHVDVKNGIISMGRMPRSRLFAWHDPRGKQDIVVFLGEAQPPQGKYGFCRQLLDRAQEFGVERVFTFAAMATQMHPEHDSRVFAVATSPVALEELKERNVEILEEGQIGGLNGVLLGAAAERGLTGTCLLGEMPHIFAQVPFPKASLAVLRIFIEVAEVDLDLKELSQQAALVEKSLGKLLAQVEEAIERQKGSEGEAEEEATSVEPVEEKRLRPEDEEKIERLFADARKDRSKAYELKSELDRLGIFGEYEDRFLDLFKAAE
jgi:proteasome assembly chaperone (PAC2) family protein